MASLRLFSHLSWHDAATGIGGLVMLAAGDGNLEDESDGLLSRFLGSDIQGATLRAAAYLGIAGAVIATIVALALS